MNLSIDAYTEAGIITVMHSPDTETDAEYSIKYENWKAINGEGDPVFIPYLDRADVQELRDMLSRMLEIVPADGGEVSS